MTWAIIRRVTALRVGWSGVCGTLSMMAGGSPRPCPNAANRTLTESTDRLRFRMSGLRWVYARTRTTKQLFKERTTAGHRPKAITFTTK